MKALVLENVGSPVVLKELNIPQPSAGQVQIKVESGCINPYDILVMNAPNVSSKVIPCVPGFEGSGVVTKSGGGAYEDSLVGKRVSFTSSGQHGSFAQYVVTSSKEVIPIKDEVSFNQASCGFGNPMTVICLLEVVKNLGANTVVQNAAASSIGRMIVRYFTKNGIKVINIVRRQEQVDILRQEGAEYVLNSSDVNYSDELKVLSAKLNATVFLDAIAGPETGATMRSLPDNTIAYVYGGLSNQDPVISVVQLFFHSQQLRGFGLYQYLATLQPETAAQLLGKVSDLLTSDLKTIVSKEFPLSEGAQAIKFYTENMSLGKVIFKPNLNM